MVKRWLVGDPLKTAQVAHERLSKRIALAVFSSDALSSVAYATEEILLVLILAGTAAVTLSIPISLAIVLLLIILTLSYRQIIFEYPAGGGAYIVARSNLGSWAGLTAAAALIIDYILTVAVSTAAGIAAVTSAVPALFPYREALCIIAIVVVMVLNLRGVRESGRIFAIPTYVFIASFILMIGAGVVHGSAQSAAEMPAQQAVEAMGLFLILRAFASGCTALTGVEVISNGVSAFKAPEAKNAAFTMTAMAAILGTLFVGISVLAFQFGVVPKADETVVSQIARLTLGEGFFYYLIQGTTMLILLLAANSAFAGFPRLACILAQDGYMPHQMACLGDRLVFSNGIVILGSLACLLIVVFRGETHALIPLYAVGVFLSFTLSQAGMVKRWLMKQGAGWRRKLVINGIGALATATATGIIASTKFMHGAWIVVLLLPLLILMFQAIHSHYIATSAQVALARDARPPRPRRSLTLIPIGAVNRAVLQAVDYARSQGGDVRALLVDVNREETAVTETRWAQWGCGVNLVVVPALHHSVVRTLIAYIEEHLEKDPDCWITVVVPEILPARWWQNLLHSQRALLLKASLLFKDRVVLTDVPFQLVR